MTQINARNIGSDRRQRKGVGEKEKWRDEVKSAEAREAR